MACGLCNGSGAVPDPMNVDASNYPPRRPLRTFLVGDLGPAIRHLERIREGHLLPTTMVLDEIEQSIARCVHRILDEVPDTLQAR